MRAPPSRYLYSCVLRTVGSLNEDFLHSFLSALNLVLCPLGGAFVATWRGTRHPMMRSCLGLVPLGEEEEGAAMRPSPLAAAAFAAALGVHFVLGMKLLRKRWGFLYYRFLSTIPNVIHVLLHAALFQLTSASPDFSFYFFITKKLLSFRKRLLT